MAEVDTTKGATAKAVEPAKPTKVVVVGNVTIHNIQLISKKFADVIGWVTTNFEPESGVASVSFNDKNKPVNKEGEPVFGMLFPETGTIMFNLLHHFNDSYDEASSNAECRLSLRAIIWHTLLITLFHEIHHSKEWVAANGAEVVWDDAKDEAATKWAVSQVFRLGKFYPGLIEPPTNEEDPFFGPLIVELRTIMTEDEDWQKRQRKLFDEGLIYTDDETNLLSFREYLRLSSDDKDSPDWGTNVTMKVAEAPKEEVKVLEPLNPLDFNPSSVTDVDFQVVVDAGMTDGDNEDTLFMSGMGVGQMSMPFTGMPAGTTPVMPTMPPVTTPGWTNPVLAAMAGGVAPVNMDNPGAGRTFAHEAPVQCAQCGLSIEEQKAIIKAVNMRLFTHIFTKCGFNPMAPTSFENAGAVFEPVPIGDIPNVNKLVLAMDTVKADGSADKKVPVAGYIKGVVFSKSNLPGYWLWINVNGWVVKRTLVPQNPNKSNAQGLSASAKLVRQGHAITWFIADGAAGQTHMKAKIACAPGQPIVYQENPFGNK